MGSPNGSASWEISAASAVHPPEAHPPAPTPVRAHVLAFVFYLVLAIVFLLPGSLHPSQALLGYPGDNFQHAWFLWHFASAVLHAQNPFHTRLLFYPHSVNLAWSTTDPLAGTLALPLSAMAGPIVAYNLSLLLQLALAGFFGYLLCLRVTKDALAAKIGGLCFGLSPFLLGEALGHLSLVTAFPIPLYFLTLDGVLQRATAGRLDHGRPGHGRLDRAWLSGVFLGAALFLTSLAHYNYTVFCALLTLVILAVDACIGGTAIAAKVVKPFLAAAFTFALLFAPFFWMMWGHPDARPRSRTIDQIEGHSADALGWLVPGWNHTLLGRFSQHWNAGLFTAGYEGTVYFGPVILLLAAVGAYAGLRTEHQRQWTIRALAAGFVFWMLSLGPHIRVWGHDSGVPGPEYLLYISPFARFISAPARFHVITTLCVALLASLGAAFFLGSHQRAHSSLTRRRVAFALLCSLLALDLLTLPFPISTSAESARSPGFGTPTEGCHLPPDFAGRTVVTVPMLDWPYPDRAMWMQLSDGGRYALADGYVSYGPDSVWSEFWKTPLLRSLRILQQGSGEPIDVSADRAALPDAIRELNLGAVVVFNFPRRDAAVDYLQKMFLIAGQPQQTCTVFDLRSTAASTAFFLH